ncbi:MAG: response regulator [Myxococcota bacterium]|jgi:DNA-binding response OmpR family regulator|nr:response regulator [Myxococcota bacterium]
MTDKKNILVIDDDADIHAFCRMVLEKEGYEVSTAFSGAEGRTAMTKSPADLVILDVMMEQPDAGFETAQWLAANHAKAPVVMLSSIADAAEGVFDTSCLKVAALINKPISTTDLVETVAKLLAARR